MLSTPVLVTVLLGAPFIGAVAVWMVGDSRPRLRDATAVGTSIVAAVACLALLPLASTSTVVGLNVGGAFGEFTFVADGLGLCMAAIATVIGSLAIVYSLDYMRSEKDVARYYALVLLFIGGMLGLVLTGSLLLLLLFWEVVGFCSCALIAFHADDPRAVSGGIRALVITQIGGLGLLVGILVARTTLGSDQVSALASGSGRIPPAALAIIAFGFLVAAAAKSAQVPFHTWLPGAMEAPTPVSALIHAATMVNAGVYLLARFSAAFATVTAWHEAVILIGVLSALLGAIMALTSSDLKRILAYSTISQLGLLFYAVGIDATFAAQFQMLSHAIFKALLFLGAGAVIRECGTRELDRLGGLASRMPLVARSFLVGAFGLAGVPFVNGFWSKELILAQPAPLWASFSTYVVGGLTALYTTRVLWRVFFGPLEQHKDARDAPVAMRVSLVLLATATLLSWLTVSALSELMSVGLPIPSVGFTPLAEVLTSPTTLVGVFVIMVGSGLWWYRTPLQPLTSRLAWLRRAALDDFGFLRVERALTHSGKLLALNLQATQTGRLSWNIAAMLIGLTVVLGALAYGGAPR